MIGHLHRSSYACSARQTGVVLFLAILMLLVLSLLGMSVATCAIAQTKMMASEHSRQVSRIAVASALSEARSKILQIATSGANQVCARLKCVTRETGSPPDAAEFMQTTSARSAANAVVSNLSELSDGRAGTGVAVSATYVVEDIGSQSETDGTMQRKRHYFRVTAGTSGGSAQLADVDETVVETAP